MSPLSSFAAPPVLRMHYDLRLRSMLPASAYALHAHTSDGDGEASCHGLLDQLASRTLSAGLQRLVRMAFRQVTVTAPCRLHRSQANCFVLGSTDLWLTLR
jgi:hypothetical protein